MAKAIAKQCECGVWFPITQGKVIGATMMCARCYAISMHPAGKGIKKVS